jgi:hypothetical protein
MHKHPWILKTVVMLLVVSPVAARAATATLRNGVAEPTFYPGGYQGVSDNIIFFYSAPPAHAAAPNVWMRSSDGKNNQIKAVNGSTNLRTLLRFDLSGLTGQFVTVTGDATMTLTVSGAEGPGYFYNFYQIAAANAGWANSSNNSGLNPTSAAVKANNGDPTWWYKSIDTVNNLPTATIEQDTTSVPWASMQVARSGVDGSSPEGYANTGGLWNWIDLVDQDPETVADSYLTMFNMDPLTQATFPASGQVTFTIPQAVIQSWIDNPADNAGMLGRYTNTVDAFRAANFWSSDTGTATNRPMLSFDYTVNPPTLEGDFNGDHSVDAADLGVWQGGFGTTYEGQDLLVWQQHLGEMAATPAVSSVPEPATVFLALGGLALLASRRSSRS